MKTFAQILIDNKKINDGIDIPWIVKCVFGNDFKPNIFGDQIALTKDSDFTDLGKTQKGVEWLVKQLGGEVSWEK